MSAGASDPAGAVHNAENRVERWWICTGPLSQGGEKVLGPFESRTLAIDVRSYVERVPPLQRFTRTARMHDTFWVDGELS